MNGGMERALRVAEFVIVVALSERVSVESGIDVAGKVAVSQ